MGLFLAPHRDCAFLIAIPQPCLLNDATAAFENIGLPIEFVIDGFANEAEGVDILEFGSGSELLRALEPNRNIGIATQTAFFHVAVADVEIFEDLLETSEIVVGFFRTCLLYTSPSPRD